MNDTKIKILVCCHKDCKRVKNDIFTPILLGSYFADDNLKNSFKDDFWDSTGENCGEMHPFMAEITAIYWAWKNYDKLGNPDYIGLFHYRRFLNFGMELPENDYWKNAFFDFDDETINRFEWKKESIENVCKNFDLLLPKVEQILDPYDWMTPCTLETHYKHSHIAEDFDTMISVVNEVAPDYSNAAEITRNSNYGYFCNMFVMKRELFFDYANFLFTVLNTVRNKIDLDSERYSKVENKRVLGFLAERIFNIWITKIKNTNIYKIGEKQRLIGNFEENEIQNFISKYGEEFYHTAVNRSRKQFPNKNAFHNLNMENVIYQSNKSANPKVSIIIPVYNVDKYLQECIESLVNQTLQELEFIFINDASTDKSAEILQTYYDKDPRIAIATHKVNEGLAGARNTGMKFVHGKYCAFIDSDDVCDITMFEKLYKKAESLSADIVTCCVSKFYDSVNNLYEHRPLWWYENDNILLPLSKRPFQIQEPAAWCKLFRTDYLRNLDYFEFRPYVKKFEDVPCITSAFIQTDKIATVNESLYFYRQRITGNLSSTMKKKDCDDFVSGCEDTVNILNNHGYTEIEILRKFEEFKFTCCDWILQNITKKDYRYACENLGKVLKSENIKYLDEWFYSHPASREFYNSIKSCSFAKVKKTTQKNGIWAYAVDYSSKKILKPFVKKILKRVFFLKPVQKLYSCYKFCLHPNRVIRNKFARLIIEQNKVLYDQLNYSFQHFITEQTSIINNFILNDIKKVIISQNEIIQEENKKIQQRITEMNNKTNLLKQIVVNGFIDSSKIDISFTNVFSKSNNIDKQIKETLSALGEFYYIPNSGNAGDAIIACATYQYFEQNGFKYHIIDKENIPEDFGKKNFNLVIGGGGVFVKEHQKGYRELFKFIENEQLNKGVILPHSIYNSDDFISLLDEKWTVFCREKQSYDYCTKRNTKASFYLSSDMAFGLDLDFYRNTLLDKSNLINFLINKNEWLFDVNSRLSVYYRDVEERVIKKINNAKIDIGIFLREDAEKKWDLGDKLPSIIDLSLFAGGGYFSDKSLTVLIARLFLASIDCFKTIVTDRLHIGICAALLNKKVMFLDNNYGKVSSVYDYSMKQMKNVKYFDNPEELIYELQKINAGIPKKLNRKNFLFEYGSVNNENEMGESMVW